MSKKRKSCCCKKTIRELLKQFKSLLNIRTIPIADIPDNCELVCNGPFCILVCYAEGGETIHCDIVCDDAGNCQVICNE
ncbi:hypothetical protein BTR22_06745 [Alkalihalophilus pseudofirmus]|uniref:Uncharacterized protein n=1 Tax=Alkalihalophilus pseudofirmus TaxID=79885 RepID=A0AAJ2NKR2_ALKPS|nr:hypothetical protein [Alkalihalophilus pseudofirmus]MDV2884584.1 hypothetical protein [Alkalihalophilus pseudofirmus]OLS38185.1 hypothetical protein BTR22_06745 [Alkalihalophilus pseudofirmus]WEG18827.1 hypothetical protein PQ478_10170 [Alkalihalophilus pseudofirmus]